MRALPVAALLLATSLAVAVPAAAGSCNGPVGPGLVGQVVGHAYDQCGRVLDAVTGGNLVRGLLDAVDNSCVFLLGSPCVP
ncbi:MAG: hypothetical protein QOI63_886 [Thermoplasmata archaeon]|jgi:hypothetical protein|nr:hypothetical protein [Thermoplasmata archaeon]